MHLQVFIVSTRKGRKGDAVARWFDARARAHGGFDVELVDLAEVNLPLFDEPEHPRLQKYQHEHTKRWSERVARADAFVLVTEAYDPDLVISFERARRFVLSKPIDAVQLDRALAFAENPPSRRELIAG